MNYKPPVGMPPPRDPAPDGMYQASFNALVMAERLKAQGVEGYWEAYAARPRAGEMIVLEPGMTLVPMDKDVVRDGLAQSIRDRMDVATTVQRPAKWGFELGGGINIVHPDGTRVKYSHEQLPAAFKAMDKIRSQAKLASRDNRTARATFFPKAKNRKCVG